MAELRILNGNNSRLKALLGDLAQHVNIKEGDAVLSCDVATEEEVMVGRAVFERLLTQGHSAFAVEQATGKSKRITEWNLAEQPMVVIVGPIVGG